MGKSVQILSLILLLKTLNSSSTRECPAPLSNGIDRYQPDLAVEPHYHDEVYCLCGRRDLNSSDLCWVKCQLCARKSHSSCYGFRSIEQVEAANHRCLSCNCYYHYYFNSQAGGDSSTKLPSKTSMILMPSTLTSQWLSEIDKHMPGCAASQISRTMNDTNTSSSKSSRTASHAPQAANTTSAPLKVFVYEGGGIEQQDEGEDLDAFTHPLKDSSHRH